MARPQESEWDDDGYDDETPVKKSGWSVGKVLGLGCLVLIILGAACGVYAWNKINQVLTPIIIGEAQKTNDAAGGLTSGEKDQVSQLLNKVVSLAESGDLSVTTAGVVVSNLQRLNKDRALEKYEAEWLLKFLQAVIDAKGDIALSQLGQYNLEDHPLTRPTEDR